MDIDSVTIIFRKSPPFARTHRPGRMTGRLLMYPIPFLVVDRIKSGLFDARTKAGVACSNFEKSCSRLPNVQWRCPIVQMS